MVEEQTPNTPQTPIEHTVENPMTPEKKVNWMKIVIGIFFGAVLLIIGALLGGRQLTQDKPIPLEQGVIPTTAPQPTQVVVVQPTTPLEEPTETMVEDEFAGWGTYVNKTLNYTIKYPPSWTIQEGQPHNPFAYFDSGVFYSMMIGAGEVNYSVYISTANELKKEYPEQVYTQQSINGYNAYLTNPQLIGGAVEYYFEKNPEEYITVSFSPYNEENPLEKVVQDEQYEIFQHMLSTFQLTE